jgi:hypothetical protein
MHAPINNGDPALTTLPALGRAPANTDAPNGAFRRRLPRRRRAIALAPAAVRLANSRVAAPPLGRALRFRRLMIRTIGAALGLTLLWLGASCYEWGTGNRVLPWSSYAACGASQPTALPDTVRIGLYEEFPAPWRLAHLKYVDFPVTLAVAAPSRAAFTTLRAAIMRQYPQVRGVYFWPLLAAHEGYYPGTWSDASAVRRVAGEAAGLPVLWDLEMPPELEHPSIASWPENRQWLDQWLRARTEPVHIWRSHASMGLDPLFLRLMGMHFDPLDYPQVSLHLDLYATGAGRPSDEMARILRCGAERYGARFIPALGVLDDGAGKPNQFVPVETLQRDLRLTRAAGIAEVWLFGLNGMNENIVNMLHQTLPLER